MGNAKHFTALEEVALEEIKRRVSRLFSIRQFILYGSKARGDASTSSDIDLLLITERELGHGERHQISHEVFEVNLKYDTQFSFLAIGEEKWNSKQYGYMPLRINVGKEGIAV